MDIKLGAAVPDLIWNEFVDVLNKATLVLAEDISKTLGTPLEPLKAALKSQMMRPYVVKYGDESRCVDMRCEYICCRPEAPLFLQACGQPVFWGGTPETSVRCPQHMYSRQLPPSNLPKLRIVKCDELEELLYAGEDGTLYDANYIARGQLTDKIILFEVAE